MTCPARYQVRKKVTQTVTLTYIVIFLTFHLISTVNASIRQEDIVDKTKTSDETTLDAKDFANIKLEEIDLRKIGIKVPEDPTMGSKDEGDIVLPKKVFRDDTTGLGRNAIRQSYRKWPNNEIPYTLSTQYGQYSRSVIAKAMNEYHTKTCVKFVPRDSKKHRDYVYIHPDDGCYSLVGRVGGRQPLSLDSGCIQTGTIVHELMHTVGFFHEQSRYDRDQFIEIVWPNVINGADDQFEKYGTNVIDQFNEPYDYSSIMHYGPYAFSANGKRTILARKPGSSKMGQRIQFSEIDLKKINRLYLCDSAGIAKIKKPPVKPQLPQEGSHFIVHPNPHGFSIHTFSLGAHQTTAGSTGPRTETPIDTTSTQTPPTTETTTATATTTPTTTTTTTTQTTTIEEIIPAETEAPSENFSAIEETECIDQNWRCAFWSMSVFGYCDQYVEIRDKICTFSCGTCAPQRSAKPADCIDKSSACSRIKLESCESPLTQLLCPRICGACEDDNAKPPAEAAVSDQSFSTQFGQEAVDEVSPQNFSPQKPINNEFNQPQRGAFFPPPQFANPQTHCYDVSDVHTCNVVRQVQLCKFRLDCARTCGFC